jgi:creatinine amidohydrolase
MVKMSFMKTIPYMFGNLNWVDLGNLVGKNLVLLLPIGATESHGPHGPLATDTISASETCLRAAAKLTKKGYQTFVLPPIAYGVTECARNFPGTISISQKTLATLISEICLQLIGHGMTKICLYSGHLDPPHVKAIYDSLDDVYEKSGVTLLFINRVRKKYIRRYPSAFQEAHHAGKGETSLMMAVDPGLINESRRKELRAMPINLVDKLFNEKLSEFKEMGLTEAYCGDPATASAELGEQGFEAFSDIIVEGAEELLQGRISGIERGLYGR